MLNKYCSTLEAAEILGVTRVTVFNWIKSKKIKAKKYGRNYLIASEEIDRLQMAEYVSPTTKAMVGDFIKLFGKEFAEFINSID